MLRPKEHAVRCFKDGFSCSQAVLSAFAPQFNLNNEMALKVASAFGGGMGSLGETCGAVTGAFMVIGLQHGKILKEDRISKGKTYAMVQLFVDEFRNKHGSISCKHLLDCDLSTVEGKKYAKENNLFSNLCPVFVEDAVNIVGKLIKE